MSRRSKAPKGAKVSHMEMQLAHVVPFDSVTPADSLPAVVPAPKKRGRPSKVAPPSVALWKEWTRRGIRAGLSVARDDAQGFDVTVAAVGGDVMRVRYSGPSDRAVPQELAQNVSGAPGIETEVTADDAAMRPQHRVTVAAGYAADALAFVECAVSRDVTRYNLNGVCFDPAGVVIGTDGHRLHKHERFPSPFSRDVIVPRAAVVTVLRAIKATKAAVLEIGRDDDKPAFIWFRCVGESLIVELRARLVDGQFPNWRQVVPSRDSYTYTTDARMCIVDVKALRAALETAPVKIDKPCRSRTLAFTPPADGGDAVCVSHDRKDRVALPVDVVTLASAFAFTLNADYLDEALAHMECDAGLFTSSDGMEPIVIENGDRVAVIMPMRA